ncbi:hypothetical protein VPNG_06357 [Cytospora leucostoma]|uniref:Uncharacterized protein n=1 Tax=Cytospora leucostoma TaxID=1230097 RepID=A0A423X1Y9_9PEZI|nr:hypothetical protein VPNG_06357 [Cytospora leucostoma]
MANQTKNYYLAPGWLYPPNSSHIALGNIISSPKHPVPALASSSAPTTVVPSVESGDVASDSKYTQDAGTQAIDLEGDSYQGIPAEPAMAAEPVTGVHQNSVGMRESHNSSGDTSGMDCPPVKAYQEGIEWTRERHLAGIFGIWTKFLQTVAGVDISTQFDTSRDEVYKFERMYTEEIFPTADFVRRAMEAPNVVSYLQSHKLHLARRSLYMIIGVKWVTGASIRTMVAKETGGKVEIGIDATAGTSVSFGPSIEVSRGIKDTVAFEGSSDFVFAFRVRKVKMRASGEMRVRDFNKGALFSADDKEQREDGEQLSKLVQVDGLEDEDTVI